MNDMFSDVAGAKPIQMHETEEPYEGGPRTVFRFGIIAHKDPKYKMLRQIAIRAAEKTKIATRTQIDYGLDVVNEQAHDGSPKTLLIRFLLSNSPITKTPERPHAATDSTKPETD